jgi:hypothetical protein
MTAMRAIRIKTPRPAPTPIPILAPEERPELDVDEPPLEPAPEVGFDDGVDVVASVIVWPFEVKVVVIEVGLAFVALADVETDPVLAVFEFDELVFAVVLAEVSFWVDAAGGDTSTELGWWPTKNCILWPVACGKDAILDSVAASVNAMVVDAAIVQLQNEPGCRVVGFPDCEHIAHSSGRSSHLVKATQGWSATSSILG